MDREIKFRGKRLKTVDPLRRWIEGSLVEWVDIYGDNRTCIVSSSGYHNDVAPDTVGQYTGLKDKNGEEIYDGDIIVQQGYSGKRPMLVRFEHGAFITGEHSGSSTSTRPMLIQKRCVVIGNIHDNPELLNRK